ncbi:MAG: MFS transporter [Bacillota bacterium]|nr:MFS transporter [Bacillota bacterium]
MELNPSKNLNNPFRALRHRSFALYWTGMCISLIGTWMQNIAQPWLAYTLTDSPLLLSLVNAMQYMPMMLFSLFAGVLVDRFPKKNILLVTQSASLVITLALAVLVRLGNVKYWHILVAATALGFVNTLDMPTRHSFVIEMVGKEDLMNAIALNSSVFNIARILGPGIAGLVMSVAGVAACFYVNSISFAAVIIVLLFIKPINSGTAQQTQKRLWDEVKDGLRYIRKEALLFKTIIIVLIVGTFGMNLSVIAPVFAKIVLHQKETGYGFLMSFMGVGSFIGAMVIASMSVYGPKKKILTLFPILLGLASFFTAFTKMYFLTAFGMALMGFFFVTFSSTANTILQYNVTDEYRGRVMSVYTLVFAGTTPIGNLFAGTVTDRLGAPAGLIGCGIMTLAPILLLFFIGRKHGRIHRIS